MGEDSVISHETFEPVEVKFGDIVQVPIPGHGLGNPGVVVGLSESELVIDDLEYGANGEASVLPTGGTHYGRIEVTGHYEGGLPKIAEVYRERFAKRLTEAQIREAIEGLETAAAKGLVTYTPAKPRTDEEWDKIMAQLQKDNPNFFRGENP